MGPRGAVASQVPPVSASGVGGVIEKALVCT